MKTTFRPTPEQQAGMTRIAKTLGKHVKNSDVMSWAVDGLISYFDAHGGKQLLVPPDFSKTFIVSEASGKKTFQETLAHVPKKKKKTGAQ